METLAHERDQFGGVIVDASSLPSSADEFTARLEQTGVQARFDALVCFRHWHGYRYGKSDIYFVARLSPLSQDVSMQAEEIEECFWMPVEEYFESDLVSTFNKRIVRAALKSPGVVPEWIDGYGDPARYEFFMPPSEEFGR